MADLFSLKNRVVLLTGASRGLGRDMALTLAGAGATVLCAGRSVKELEATARAITKKGGKAHVVPIDITNEEFVCTQVRAIIRKHRRIDVLVNNAGVIHRQDIVDTATADFRKVIETDLIGQFVLSREVGRHMLARQYGRIVNISSVLAVLGRASVAGYVSAKHGLIGAHQEARDRVRPLRHRQRDRAGLYPHRAQRAAAEEQGVQRACSSSARPRSAGASRTDLRGALLLLASDAGAYITGHTLVIDGGMSTILWSEQT